MKLFSWGGMCFDDGTQREYHETTISKLSAANIEEAKEKLLEGNIPIVAVLKIEKTIEYDDFGNTNKTIEERCEIESNIENFEDNLFDEIISSLIRFSF